MDTIESHVKDSREYYDETGKRIDEINVNITKKGFLFEDMQNVLEQIDPLVKNAMDS